MNNKIAVVVAYFGKFPNYFPLWLKSCEYNPTIDFLVVTDHQLDLLPTNVKCIQMTLADVRERASIALGFPATLDCPYKCCDYKPIYGLLFSNFLRDYDYWGHCDVDLIFGDIREFLEENDYTRYDHFLTQGHLAFYRNTEAVNNYFRLPGSKCGDYQSVFTTNVGKAFDENGGIAQIFLWNHKPMFHKNIYADVSPIYKRFRRSQFNDMDEVPHNYKHQVFYWENGKTFMAYYENGEVKFQEFVYIHFQKRPNFAPIELCEGEKEGFYITNTGFHRKTSAVTLKDIKRYNPYRGRFVETLEYYRWKCRKRYKSIIRRYHRLVQRLYATK